jgi:hypothetical protein
VGRGMAFVDITDASVGQAVENRAERHIDVSFGPGPRGRRGG